MQSGKSFFSENGVGKNSHSLEEFFVNCLRDIYYAEKAIQKELPKFIKAATTQKVKDAFSEHNYVTGEQIRRLERVFDLLGLEADDTKCEAINGIIREGRTVVKRTDVNSMVRDVGLIVAAQKIEHYEIVAYGSMVELARIIGWHDIAEQLSISLDEEKSTDSILTDLAVSDINIRAKEEVHQDEIYGNTGRRDILAGDEPFNPGNPTI